MCVGLERQKACYIYRRPTVRLTSLSHNIGDDVEAKIYMLYRTLSVTKFKL